MIWGCINAENTAHMCDHSYCSLCFSKINESGRAKRKKTRGNVCDHGSATSYKEADVEYIVGDYADSVREQGGKLPIACKGCSKLYK